MKICFIVGEFPNLKCGIGDYTSLLANNLANDKVEVSVITSKEASSENKKIKIYNIIDEYNFNSIKIILSKLKEIKPDIVHIQYPSNKYVHRRVTSVLLPLSIKFFLKNIKLVETIHEYPEYLKKGKLFYSLNYSIMDYIIIAEEKYNDFIKKDFEKIYNKLNIKYIPIGSNIPKSEMTDVQKQELRKKLGIENFKIISYFGFASDKKGIEILLDSFKYIKNSNVKLLFIGELNKENSYHNKLLNLITELNLEENIIITGFIEDPKKVSDYLAISDICVLPFVEGAQTRNTSYLAAVNQDINVITTSLDEKKDFDNIFFVKPNNSKILADKIDEVLETKKCKNECSKDNWRKIVDEHCNIYKKIIN